MDPGRIWLLFGIPISELSFLARLAGKPDTAVASDFLAHYDAPGAPEAERLAYVRRGWAEDYVNWVARPLSDLADRARAYRMRVVEDAGLAQLELAASEAQVVILVSHWKGPEFANQDFLDGVEAALRAGDWDDPLFRWIEAAINPGLLARLLGRRMSVRQALRASLHVDLGPGETAEWANGVAAFAELPATRAARRRELLDRRLAAHLKPGNRLELAEGLFSRENVAAAVAGFRGVLDLTTCTSTYLGDYLGQACGHRCRTVQFVDVQEPVDAAARLISTLDLVAGGHDYLRARWDVAEEFGYAVEDIAKEALSDEPA